MTKSSAPVERGNSAKTGTAAQNFDSVAAPEEIVMERLLSVLFLVAASARVP
jgi:hypothetical protein